MSRPEHPEAPHGDAGRWRRPLVHRCRHPVVALPQVAILIGGCGRSGTTLLQSLLSAHPRIQCIKERDRGIETNAFTGVLDPPPRSLDRLYRRHLSALPGSVTHWCEKSARNIHNVPAILELFGDAVRFLHIVRDGRDALTSRHPRNPDSYWGSPNRWVAALRKGLAVSEDPRVLTLRYEDLILDTDAELRRLCRFCDLPWSDAFADYPTSSAIRVSKAWFGEARPLDASSIGRWRAPEHRQRVQQLLATPGAVELLEHHDYPTP